jgi:hypothetical protein
MVDHTARLHLEQLIEDIAYNTGPSPDDARKLIDQVEASVSSQLKETIITDLARSLATLVIELDTTSARGVAAALVDQLNNWLETTKTQKLRV